MPMKYANIINITRFCTDDGPGIRTTVFLKGCPLRCAWCHNPESQHAHPEIMFDKKACTHCGLCVSVCSVGAHSILMGQHTFDPTLCIQCGRCAEICPSKALELSGKQMSTTEVFEEVEKDSIFYGISGGGITISGGEPFMHPEFTAELLHHCKKAGIHTAIETSGFASKDSLAQILPHCDLVLFDIKETDSEKHLLYTGVPMDPIINNLHYLDELGIETILRAPIIPGWNDREEHLSALRNIRDSLLHCRGLQIMPYHSMGAYKYEKLQRPYQCANISDPIENTIAYWRKIVE